MTPISPLIVRKLAFVDAIERLAIESNGAIEVDEANGHVIKIVLGGPIKNWWAPGQWETEGRRIYMEWRDAVRAQLVKSGFLVYSPHRAWQGSWHEDAQLVNDQAIRVADYFVDLTPKGIPNVGTQAEIRLANTVGTAVYTLPPGTVDDITRAIWHMKVNYDKQKYRPECARLARAQSAPARG